MNTFFDFNACTQNLTLTCNLLDSGLINSYIGAVTVNGLNVDFLSNLGFWQPTGLPAG